MDRRDALTALLAGLAGAVPGVRSAAAQHHAMTPSTGTPAAGSGDGPAVLVFAAATLKSTLDAIVSAYRRKEGDQVTVSYGPTPTPAQQSENAAREGIFLSASP